MEKKEEKEKYTFFFSFIIILEKVSKCSITFPPCIAWYQPSLCSCVDAQGPEPTLLSPPPRLPWVRAESSGNNTPTHALHMPSHSPSTDTEDLQGLLLQVHILVTSAQLISLAPKLKQFCPPVTSLFYFLILNFIYKFYLLSFIIFPSGGRKSVLKNVFPFPLSFQNALPLCLFSYLQMHRI